MQLPIDERHGYSRKYVEGRLAILLGGRAAELKIFNELTTGAGNDIEQATVIAKKMVCEWGMSDLLGPVTFGKKNEEIFLGREIQSHRDFSDVTARMIDEEISRIIRIAQKRAHELIGKHEKILHLMAEELIKYETIDDSDVKRIMSGKKIIRRRNNGQQGVRKIKPITDKKNQRSGKETKKQTGISKPISKTQASTK